jgi:hypothetical protein
MYCSLGPTALDIVYLLFVFSDFSLIQGYLSKWSSSFFFSFPHSNKDFSGPGLGFGATLLLQYTGKPLLQGSLSANEGQL